MTDGYETVGELGRAFDAFRALTLATFEDVREEQKWQRRWFTAILTTILLAGLGSSVWLAR